MQMLQQFFGEQGARYATFLITLLVLLIVVIFVWWMIRKALGDRLNMSDKPDRRGRPPRLGITESFTVDRQGRRLVMVRRDNVEHLIMIGGPNDFVVETNVVRGERPVVSRQDQRTADTDLVPVLSVGTAETLPKIVEQPKVLEQRTSFAPLPPAVVQTAAPNPPTPLPVAPLQVAPPKPAPLPPATVVPPVVASPVVTPPVKAVEISAPVAVSPAPVMSTVKETIAENTPAPVVAKPLSLAERIKASLPMGNSSKIEAPKVEIPKAEAIKLSDLPKTPELPKMEAPKVELPKFDSAKIELPKPEPIAVPKIPTADDVKSKLEDIFKQVPVAAPPVVASPVASVSPVPAAVVPPIASAAPSVPAGPAVIAPVTSPPPSPKPVSKNPFDSLEEEMAKLLGRAPDGKS
jgi:flagellar protein FliO/FliZ